MIKLWFLIALMAYPTAPTIMYKGFYAYDTLEACEKNRIIVENSIVDVETKRGGSFDADSYEYEKDRWENNSKMLKGRDKNLGQWEKKVKKALDSLMKDYVKAWKV